MKAPISGRRIRSKNRKQKASGASWPMEIRNGSASVKIYRTYRRGEPLYSVAHYMDGSRKRKTFADPAKAEQEANRIASLISRAEKDSLHVNSMDWRLYNLAVNALSGLEVPIDAACREYAEAKKIIGNTPLVIAVKAYIKRHEIALAEINVPDLVEEFIKAKTNSGVGPRVLADYRSRLRRFAKKVRMPIASVTKDILQEFIGSLKVEPRTRRNFQSNLVTLFQHARARGFLERDIKTEAEHLDTIVVPEQDIEIFPTKDLAKLLAAADSKLQPYIAIRAFAGVRDSEINRMQWSDVKFAENTSEVRASVAKPKRGKKAKLRRLTPILPNLKAWLEPYIKKEGPICAYSSCERQAVQLAASLEINWVHNGLRHGFGSCRVAMIKNYPQVAYEMGNNVDVVKSSYDQVVSEKEARKWFAISPEPKVPRSTV